MINTVATETVNYYQIHWLKEDGEQGKHAEPVMMTEDELSEYMEHLFHDWEYYHEELDWERMTFTALPISEESYREVINKHKYTSNEVYTEVCEQIEDIIGRHVIDIFGFIDKPNIYLSNWYDIWKSNKDADELYAFIDVLGVIPVKGEFYFRHQGLCGHYFYSELLDSPSWLEITLWSELGTRNTCDDDHVFIQGFQNSGEMKDGYPVYECILQRM